MPGRIAPVGFCVCLALSLVIPAAAQDAEPLKRARELNAEVHRLLNEGRYREGIPKGREALAIREQALGPNHPDVATSLNNLGWLLMENGDYAEARPLLEWALLIREQVFGPNHLEVAGTLNLFGHLLYLSGDYSAARPLLERSLKIREQTFRPDHPVIAMTLNNLGLLLHHGMGDYGGARTLHERALRIREQALGPSHALVAQSLSNLADVLRDTGNYTAALRLHERALLIREQTLGPIHPAVAQSLHALGYLLHRTGDYGGARPLYERALKIREQALGPNYPAVAQSLSALAFLHQTTRNYPAARPLYERALQIREQTLGPTHPVVGWSLNGLGWLLWYMRDDRSARPVLERTLVIARSADTPELRWRSALGLGRVHEREGRPIEAIAMYQEAMRTVEKQAGQFGEEGSRTTYLQAENRLAVYDALARLLLKLHEQDSTKGYDREAFAVLEARKGRIVAEALGAARPKLQDPKAREEAEKAQAKQDRVLALEQALREEQTKALKEQQPEKVQNLTALLAQTKGEYLAQVQAFLARYPKYKSQFVDQQTVDPKLLAKFADRLPAGTLAVQYFASPDALFLFVVAPGGRFQVKSQAVSQADLYDLIRQ